MFFLASTDFNGYVEQILLFQQWRAERSLRHAQAADRLRTRLAPLLDFATFRICSGTRPVPRPAILLCTLPFACQRPSRHAAGSKTACQLALLSPFECRLRLKIVAVRMPASDRCSAFSRSARSKNWISRRPRRRFASKGSRADRFIFHYHCRATVAA